MKDLYLQCAALADAMQDRGRWEQRRQFWLRCCESLGTRAYAAGRADALEACWILREELEAAGVKDLRCGQRVYAQMLMEIEHLLPAVQ